MILYVKNMVSERCKLFVEEELKNVGLRYTMVDLGVIDIAGGWTQEQREELERRLVASGLEIMINRKSALIERTEMVIREMINNPDELAGESYSDHISRKLGEEYTLLSRVFSEKKGITIQQYIILAKVERIIELLAEGELSLTEISYKLHYSSVAHLSNQFKKVTGFSPSDFKRSDKASTRETLPFISTGDSLSDSQLS